VAPSVLWKLGLAAVLGAVIIASASARAPRTRLTWTDLRWLLLGALALYAVGLIALFKHLSQAAILLFAAGIAASALAAWLSRGTDHGGGPPRGDEPVDEQPPPDPNGLPAIDWAAFEREVRAYAERSRDLVSTR
jgi:uncharacterized membrane protein YfcA